VIQNCDSTKVHRELLLALESARTRLAIAIASESKSTPLDQWQYYLATTDRMGRYIKKLRKSKAEASSESKDLDRALDLLRTLPVHDRAMKLCRLIHDIVAGLE
jgi:hypothetical protein